MGENKIAFGNEHPITFDYGNYHFIGLDSAVFPYSTNGNISDSHIVWLKNDLQSNTDKQLVAFSHQPLYFRGKTTFWLNGTIANNIMMLYSTYGISAVLQDILIVQIFPERTT